MPIYGANYNNSLTWIKAIWGWFPLLIMIPVRSQWSRYNLPRYMGCLYHPISPEFLWKRWYQRILFCGGALDGTSMGPMTCAPFGIYDVRIQNGVTPEENQHETLKMAPYTEKIWENHISQVQNLMLHGFLIPVIPSYHVAGIGPQNMSCGIVFWDTVLKKMTWTLSWGCFVFPCGWWFVAFPPSQRFKLRRNHSFLAYMGFNGI